jgi:hypothetical protein
MQTTLGGNQEPTQSATLVAAPSQTQGDSPVATDVASIGRKTAPRFSERAAQGFCHGLQGTPITVGTSDALGDDKSPACDKHFNLKAACEGAGNLNYPKLV